MKISLNWLKQYIDVPVDHEELSEILTALGLEVEGVDHFESIKGGLEGIVVGLVTECGKHPNADRLSLTKVNIGADNDLQIVCGAPNVEKGQKVLVATVGTTLHPVNADPWVINKGKIRGTISEGMICAEDELGLGDNHSGIIVLPDDVEIGKPASNYYHVEKDIVFDIALTPNRSDATSHIGVARDLAAYLKINHDATEDLNLPDLNSFKTDYVSNDIEVIVEDEQGCPRYSGVVISGVKVKESPQWLKNRLSSIGLRPINNIVDITNFVLHEFGQPLHAFDAEKIYGQKIIVKSLPSGSSFVSLDGENRELNKDDLMICDGQSKGMCIAGVFGGINSGVTESTTKIFLESAHFNAKRVRKTSMRHLLRTDAAMIFEKGSDPNITVKALKRAAMMIKELGDGEISSDIIDVYREEILPKEITLSYKQISNLIGIKIPREKIHEIFHALEIEISNATEELLRVKVPTNKSDVTRPADVIEEILRIYGFNNIPVSKSFHSGVQIGESIDKYKVRKKISSFLSSRGWNEAMNLSLVPSKYYKDLLPVYDDHLVYINNTSNTSLDIMRPEMLLSNLMNISYNQNRQQENTRFFEFGNSYKYAESNEIREHELLTISIKGDVRQTSWLDSSNLKATFFDIKREILALCTHMGIEDGVLSEIQDDKRFEYGLILQKNGKEVLCYGKVNPEFSAYFDIRGSVFYSEIYMETIYSLLSKKGVEYYEINKYPSTKRDLALVIDEEMTFDKIEKATLSTDKKWIKDIQLFDVYRNDDQLGKNKKSYAVSFVFSSEDKTLKDKEVDKVMKKLIANFEKNLGAKIRQ